MLVLDHVRADWSVFRTSMFEYCDVVANMGHQQQESILQVIAEVLDRACGVPILDANSSSAGAVPQAIENIAMPPVALVQTQMSVDH